MHAAISTRVSSKVIAGVVALSLGAAMLVGVSGVSADGGDSNAPCIFNGTSYRAGTQLTVDGTAYNCIDGAWTSAPVRVPSDSPAYTPPQELTPITTLQEEFHPVNHGSKFLQQSIRSDSTSRFPH